MLQFILPLLLPLIPTHPSTIPSPLPSGCAPLVSHSQGKLKTGLSGTQPRWSWRFGNPHVKWDVAGKEGGRGWHEWGKHLHSCAVGQCQSSEMDKAGLGLEPSLLQRRGLSTTCTPIGSLGYNTSRGQGCVTCRHLLPEPAAGRETLAIAGGEGACPVVTSWLLGWLVGRQLITLVTHSLLGETTM